MKAGVYENRWILAFAGDVIFMRCDTHKPPAFAGEAGVEKIYKTSVLSVNSVVQFFFLTTNKKTCHPEFISGYFKIPKQVRNDNIIKN